MLKKALFTALTAAAVMSIAVPAFAETYTAENGVISIDVPNENWKEITDPTKWIALSDGANVITIEHYSNGEELPEMTIADDHYVNVYQGIFSTQNEVFIITGAVVDEKMNESVVKAIGSAKVLKFDTKMAVKKESPKAAEFTIVPMEATLYVTTDGLNVRMGCSTTSEIIGAYSYGQSVKVTGKVQRNGADYGWYRVDYEGGSGYVAAGFLSETAPAAQENKKSGDSNFTGRSRTIYKSDATAVTVYETTDGTWFDSEGREYIPITEYTFNTDDGTVLTINRPVTDETPTGEEREVYWGNGNMTTVKLYSDNVWYSEYWVGYIYDDATGIFMGNDGTRLYMIDPAQRAGEGDIESYELTSEGSGRPVIIYKDEDSDSYSDGEGNSYYRVDENTFVDDYDAYYTIYG